VEVLGDLTWEEEDESWKDKSIFKSDKEFRVLHLAQKVGIGTGDGYVFQTLQ